MSTKRIKTATSQTRIYRDFGNVTEKAIPMLNRKYGAPKDVKKDLNFPVRLHYMMSEMENDGQQDIIAWRPHGRCFSVNDPVRLEKEALPLWFRQTKYASFQRQLNIYGFVRINDGADRGCYYHEMFLRGKQFLAGYILRQEGGKKTPPPRNVRLGAFPPVLASTQNRPITTTPKPSQMPVMVFPVSPNPNGIATGHPLPASAYPFAPSSAPYAPGDSSCGPLRDQFALMVPPHPQAFVASASAVPLIPAIRPHGTTPGVIIQNSHNPRPYIENPANVPVLSSPARRVSIDLATGMNEQVPLPVMPLYNGMAPPPTQRGRLVRVVPGGHVSSRSPYPHPGF